MAVRRSSAVLGGSTARGRLATIGRLIALGLLVGACTSLSPTAPPASTPTSAAPHETTVREPGPNVDCLPTLTPNAEGLPLLTCEAAVAAARTRLPGTHPDISRIEFRLGAYCPPDANCLGHAGLIGGYVLFEFADGSLPVVVTLFENSAAEGIRVSGVETIATPQPLITYSFTIVNSATMPVIADFSSDASGGCEGLYPGQRATIVLYLRNPSGGFGLEVYRTFDRQAPQRIATTNFPTPNPITIVIDDGPKPGTVTLSTKPAPTGPPLPAPSPMLGCQGG